MSAPSIGRVVAPESVQELREGLQGDLLTRADATYETARQAWNAMVDKRPALIAQYATSTTPTTSSI
jgi:hypothetical protein